MRSRTNFGSSTIGFFFFFFFELFFPLPLPFFFDDDDAVPVPDEVALDAALDGVADVAVFRPPLALLADLVREPEDEPEREDLGGTPSLSDIGGKRERKGRNCRRGDRIIQV